MSIVLNNSFLKISNGVYTSIEVVPLFNQYQITTLLLTTGSGSFTKPAGVINLIVECWGGGGGGGSATTASAGGGGAGGNYAKSILTYPSASQSINYVIGKGGAGAISGFGFSGSITTWDTNLVVAGAGAGGFPNQTGSLLTGPYPPTASYSLNNTGSIVYFGANGFYGNIFVGVGATYSGGTGGDGPGTSGQANSGLGNQLYGGTGGNGSSISSTGTSSGFFGSNYAAGGNGGANVDSIVPAIGGSGSQGLVRVSYTLPSLTYPANNYLTQLYPLDNFTGSTAAWSVRQLKSNSTASMMVMRDSDFTSQSIGFVTGSLDIATLVTFVGTDSGYVTTWYDQSGNNLHAKMTNTGSAPIIITSGTLMLTNNTPALFFNGGQQLITPPVNNITDNSGNWFTFGVGSAISGAILPGIILNADNTTSTKRIAQPLRIETNGYLSTIAYTTASVSSSVSSSFFYGATGSLDTVTSTLGLTTPGQFIAYSARNTSSLFISVDSQISGSRTTIGTPVTSSGTNTAFVIGNYQTSSFTTASFNGTIQEIIHFGTSSILLSTYQNGLIGALDAFYNTF